LRGNAIINQIEKRFIRKNGIMVLGHLTVSLVRGDNNEPRFAISMLEDITERKKLEVKLRQSEELFSKAFHASPVAISITTLPEGRIIDVNDSFIRIMGFSRDEVIRAYTA